VFDFILFCVLSLLLMVSSFLSNARQKKYHNRVKYNVVNIERIRKMMRKVAENVQKNTQRNLSIVRSNFHVRTDLSHFAYYSRRVVFIFKRKRGTDLGRETKHFIETETDRDCLLNREISQPRRLRRMMQSIRYVLIVVDLWFYVRIALFLSAREDYFLLNLSLSLSLSSLLESIQVILCHHQLTNQLINFLNSHR
jgi:hypothetical protein